MVQIIEVSQITKFTEIDVIIISYAYNDDKRALTIQTIETLLASESPKYYKFNIFVIESDKNTEIYEYPNTITLKPDQKFGYHTYLNIGVRKGKAPWLVLANNDLIFHKGWFRAILQAKEEDPELESFGTWCNKFHKSKSVSKIPKIQYGYTNGIHVTGWLIVLTRELYNRMSGLDEKFYFWYCDDDYRMTIKQMEVKHALITNSEVSHLTSQTTNELSLEKYRHMTLLPNLYFDYKWNHKSYIVYILKKIILSLKKYGTKSN
jgi:GT2 family glycosyltransferase